MENLLNEDGTSSFTNISELRNNFEESFAKKQLGATMKDIVIKAISGIDNKNCQNVLSDDNVKKLIGNSINEIADKAFTNTELGDNTFIGSLKQKITEYAGMEADYRYELANAWFNNLTDKVESSKKIFNLFSTESLNFKSNEIKNRFLDEIESEFATEAEDIVTAIGKEVGAAIAEAEEKNVVINQTAKVIQEQRDEIREELSLTDEDDEEENKDDSDSKEFDDTQDLGDEETEESGEETDDYENNYGDGNSEDSGTEDYEDFGMEGLSSDQLEEINSIIKKDIPKIKASLIKMNDKMSKELENTINSKGMHVSYKPTNTKEEFSKLLNEKLDDIRIISASNRKIDFNMGTFDYDDNITQRVIGIICICLIGFITLPLGIVLVATSGSKNKKIVRRAAENNKEYKSISFKVTKNKKSGSIHAILTLKPRNILKNQGIEDYENEIDEIETSLSDKLQSDIDNGKVTIGEVDISNKEDTPVVKEDDIIDVEKHEEDKIVNNEEPDVEVSTTVTDVSADDTGIESLEFIKQKYSNDNMGKVIVPLSPTRLDTITIPSVKALGTIYSKSTESLDSLKSVVSARLDLLKDIVDREHDEELSKKYTDYSKRALESFNFAFDVQNTLNSVGITPFGIEDINDPTTLYIGSKVYKFLNGKLNLKNREAKRSFESVNDAIDAAFDISIMKDSLRGSEDNDTVIALSQEIQSREDLFWNNITDIHTDDEKKTQIKNILQLCDLNIDKKALVDNEYLKSIKLALDTTKVKGEPGKSEYEINEELFTKSKEKIESFLGKDINPDQEEIIRAMIEGRDTSDFAPTPFEKFIIKFGNDEAIKKNGGKDFELGQESSEQIKNKAITLSVLESVINRLNPMSKEDTDAFKKYIF